MKKFVLFYKKAFIAGGVTALSLLSTGCGCLTVKTTVSTVQSAVVAYPTTVIYPDYSTEDTGTNVDLPEGVSLPTLRASNLSVPAGTSIDYLGNLVIEDESDTEITEIYVNTSNVRPNVPGVYNATYTVDFRGYQVSKTIVVTITPPENETENPTYAATLSGTPISDMTVKLLSGTQCKVSCTTEHYILESYTEERYEEIQNRTYLISVLKVLFNDGEIIELETAKNRVVNAG